MAVERIGPRQAHSDRKSTPGALLVCAYDDEAKCRKYHLEGAITLADLKAQESAIPKSRELIFY